MKGFYHWSWSKVCFHAKKNTVQSNYLLWRSFHKMISHFFHAQSQLSPFLSYLKPQEVPAFSKINWSDMSESLSIFMFTQVVKPLTCVKKDDQTINSFSLIHTSAYHIMNFSIQQLLQEEFKTRKQKQLRAWHTYTDKRNRKEDCTS